MSSIILAIDDNPERYDILAGMLFHHGIAVVCVQNPNAVNMILKGPLDVKMILLDHDMPTFDPEGDPFHGWNGTYYLSEVLFPCCPVVITSANVIARQKMIDIAKEMSYDIVQIPVTTKDYSKTIYDYFMKKCSL